MLQSPMSFWGVLEESEHVLGMSGPRTEGRAKAFKAASECSYGQRNDQHFSAHMSLPFVQGPEMLRTCRPLRLLLRETWALLHFVRSANMVDKIYFSVHPYRRSQNQHKEGVPSSDSSLQKAPVRFVCVFVCLCVCFRVRYSTYPAQTREPAHNPPPGPSGSPPGARRRAAH